MNSCGPRSETSLNVRGRGARRPQGIPLDFIPARRLRSNRSSEVGSGKFDCVWLLIDGGSRFMPTVTVEGEKSFEVEAGKKLVLAIEDAGIDIMHRCGGNARCTTCRVQILAGDVPPMEATEQERLARETNLSPTPACLARFGSNPTCGFSSSTDPVKPEYRPARDHWTEPALATPTNAKSR